MYTITGTADKNSVLTQYAPLVKRIAHHLMARLPSSVDVDDLIQVGMIGLLDAVSRYQETVGVQFESYATQRVRGAMLDELRRNDWLPRGLRKDLRRIEEAISKLQQRLGRAPTEKELAAEMKLSLAEYQTMLQEARGYQLVHYEDFNEGDEENIIDRNCADGRPDPLELLLDARMRETLIEAIQGLPEREKLMMGLYYEQELNLKEIGAIMGVSESRVSQLHSQAIARLRSKLRESTWTSTA